MSTIRSLDELNKYAASKTGDNTQPFKVANAVNADEAVSKGQLENTTHTFTARQKITSGGTNALELSRKSTTSYNGMQFSTNGTINFLLYQINNADGDLLIQSRLDDGTIIGTALRITRSTGVIDFPINATVKGNQIWHNGNCPVSKATNGYQKLPNGLIIQWGTGTSSSGGTVNTFPIAFPNAILLCIDQHTGADTATNTTASSKSKTGYTSYTEFTSNPIEVNYIAIGY